MSEQSTWPVNPEDGIPPTWKQHIDDIDEAVAPSRIKSSELRARAQMLLDEMLWQRVIFEAQARRAAAEAGEAQQRHRQTLEIMAAAKDAADDQARAASRQTKSLLWATYVLAGSTVVLAIATIGLWLASV